MSRRMLMAVLSLVLIAPALRAQDKPAAPAKTDSGNSDSNRSRDRGSDRGGTPEERSARYTNFIKDRLGEVSDDEWKVIQPKLQKVMEIRRDQMSGMFGGRDRGGSSSDETPKTGVAGASADLRKALENKSATPEEISKKLTALREAKAKAKGELEGAQKELKEVLTQRQEASLVMMGMLD